MTLSDDQIQALGEAFADMTQRKSIDWKSRAELAESALAEANRKLAERDESATTILAILGKNTEGETRAFLEALSCRLGYGHIADLPAPPIPELEEPLE